MVKNNKYWWRRIFSGEQKRVDMGMDDVWIRNDRFILVKFPSTIRYEGKWGVFTPLDRFIGRTESKSPPLNWANKLIAEKMHDKSYDEKENYINDDIDIGENE